VEAWEVEKSSFFKSLRSNAESNSEIHSNLREREDGSRGASIAGRRYPGVR
jgi:hypothetical protein